MHVYKYNCMYVCVLNFYINISNSPPKPKFLVPPLIANIRYQIA